MGWKKEWDNFNIFIKKSRKNRKLRCGAGFCKKKGVCKLYVKNFPRGGKIVNKWPWKRSGKFMRFCTKNQKKKSDFS